MRMSPDDRAARVVRFLQGLRDPEVALAMKARGFTEDDRREAYRLLEEQTAGALDVVGTGPRDPRAAEHALDAWENEWFPIADASLRRRFPAAHEFLFARLGQTSGTKVVLSAGKLLGRLENLPGSGVEGAAEAIAHLAKRGLGPETIAKGRALLDDLLIGGPPGHENALEPAELERRDEALWSWYLEWSAIARVAIKKERLLRKLGFAKVGRRRRAGAAAGEGGDAEG